MYLPGQQRISSSLILTHVAILIFAGNSNLRLPTFQPELLKYLRLLTPH